MIIELKNKILNDKYTEYIYNVFDIQNKDESIVNIPMSLGEARTFDWNIGIILGGSGSGKTTILNQIGKIKEVKFDLEKPLISNFDWLEPDEATIVLTSMGLSSVPTWLRPFNLLSNGEKYRATLAYMVSSAKEGEYILIDEYTSVVDRDVAKAMSFALQKYIRRENKRIILASCHYDILEWLMPDWTCSPQKGGALERCDYLRQGRPEISLQVSRVEPDTWNIFKEHHYLTSNCNKGFGYLLFEWQNKPVGIVVYKNQPNGYIQNSFGLSRTVVLPDYQGMGIGSKISEFTAKIIRGENNLNRVFTKTINPALGEYREKSPLWKPTSKNKVYRSDIKGKNKRYKHTVKRNSYCHEYIGDGLGFYQELLLPIKEMRNNIEL